MTALRTKVVPPFDPRGTIVFHGFVGALLNLPSLALQLIGAKWPGPVIAFAGNLILWGCSLVGFAVPAFMAALLASRCQKNKTLFWSGVAFGSAYFATACYLRMMRQSNIVFAETWQAIVGILIVLIIIAPFGALCGLLYLLVNLIFRNARYVVVEQDGSLCWSCAYKVGNPPVSDRCPECGEAIHPPTRPGHDASFSRFCKRHARIFAACVVLLMVSTLVARALSTKQHVNELRGGIAGTPTTGTIMSFNRTGPAPTWTGGRPGVAVWRPVPSDARMALMVVWDQDAAPGTGQTPMQIQLMGTTKVMFGETLPSWGNPAISCDLNAEQAAWVLKHDVPQSLIDAMVNEAKKTKWAPLPAGGMVSCIEVKADAHFGANKK